MLLSTNAISSELYYECSTCNHYSDFEKVAKQIALEQNTSKNDINIFNPNTLDLIKIRVINTRSFEPGVPNHLNAYEVSLSNEELNAKRVIINARYVLNHGEYDIPSKTADSIYDLVGSSNKQNIIEQFIRDNSTWNENIGHYTNAILSSLCRVVGINFVVNVKFDDGSIAQFKIDGIRIGYEIEFKFIAGIDNQGNDVPIEKKHFEALGEFVFKGESGQRTFNEFAAAAQGYGITISNSNVGKAGTWSCYQSETGVVCQKN